MVSLQHGIKRMARWTPDEDGVLLERVKQLGLSRWAVVAQALPGRTNVACRMRYLTLEGRDRTDHFGLGLGGVESKLLSAYMNDIAASLNKP
jgi:hypothetical protein